MKKIFFALTIIMAMFVSAAMAAEAVDGAALYKARCAGCHAADGTKMAAEGVAALKGQSEAAVYKKLQGYADGSFGGAKKMGMAGIAKSLKDDQLKAVSKFIGTL